VWVVKAIVLFLLIWGVWYLCWTLIFAGGDIAFGKAPFPVMLGALVALLVVGIYLERRRRKKGGL